MKLLRMGLQVLSVIAEHGERTTNAKIHNETGISYNSIHNRLAYYAKEGIIKITGKGTRARVIKLTDKGVKWVLEQQRRKAFFEVNGRQPKVYKAPNPDAKQRECLGPDCGRTFKSEWAGDRICSHCKSTQAWRGSQCEDYMVRYG